MRRRVIKNILNGAVVLMLAVFFVGVGILFTARLNWTTASSAVEVDSRDTESTPTSYARLASQGSAAGGSIPESPFVVVAERLKPAVVNITAVRNQGVDPHQRFWDIEPFREFFRDRIPDREPQRHRFTSGGTGVIIDRRGYVVTNNHLVADAVSVVVTLVDGTEREARVIGADPETDLAVLNIGDVGQASVAKLGDSDAIRIGDWAIAMGNPFGLDWTLTVGVISAKGRSNLNIAGGGPSFQDFIQTDASINFGNSGGPLANIHGEVIGINSAINAAANGIGFAIPIDMVKEVVDQLLNQGYVIRGYLGMVPSELDPLRREALGLKKEQDGIFVESVQRDTPAEDGGLRATDVITEVDGVPVNDVTDFRLRIARHKPGEKLSLNVIRKSRKKRLNFILADRSEFIASAGSAVGGFEWMGIGVVALNSPQARRLDLEVEEGVLVVDINEDSPAEGKLSRGDVIVKVDDAEIGSIADWQEAIGLFGETDRAILIMFYPQGRGSSRFVAIKK